ncbi:hypothetical protein HQ38_00725 [Porphyromonas crevioricanis]|uniref:Major fimbrial subunit protein N-terminal domain-containing protein n=2 Tax=Porphyromonas crevioricanis TaxID=393921 RepID=A0AB34PHD6_9PORP|nr:hypothetical protein HQ38_00725 [Porphyromonas crevioricanis]
MITSLAGWVLAGFSSCSQTEIREREPQVVDELVSPSLDGITFSLHFSGQDPKEVNTRAIHDNAEWDINDLQVFVFDSENKFLKRVEVTKGSGKGKFNTTGVTATYTYPLHDDLSDYPKANSIRQFFFLANAAPITDMEENTSTLQNLHEKVFAAQQTEEAKSILTPVSGRDYIPMTGMATFENGKTLIPYTKGMQATVILTRVVARIDVVNRIPGLKITELTLHNTFQKSRVSASTAEIDRFSGSVKTYASLGAGLQGARDGSKKLAKAFYLYEGKNLDEGGKCVYVRVKGELSIGGGSTTTFFYTIPFKTKELGSAVLGAPIDVKRNHLYTIILGSDKDKGTLDFSFTDEPWNMHTFYEPFSPVMATAPQNDAVYTYKLAGIGAADLSFKKAGGTATLMLNCRVEGHTTFNIDDTSTLNPGWLTGVPTLNGDGNKTLTIKAPVNSGTTVRRGTIIITSDTGEKLTLNVTQAH